MKLWGRLSRYRLIVGLGAACIALTLWWGLLRHVHMRALPLWPEDPAAGLVGAFHAHSVRSHDSRVSLADMVAAAREAGLQFLVLTDHNAPHQGPQVLDDVIVISHAELSTPWGHVVGLGAPRTLERDERNASNVLARLAATGAAPVVTHPTDSKRPWNGSWEGAAGLEIANLAASARREGGMLLLGLLPLLGAWPLNAPLALAQLYDRDDAALALWDAHADPAFVGLCGSDAHGWITLPLNLMAWSITLDARVTATPAAIVAALRQGRFACTAGLLGHRPPFKFAATRGGAVVARPPDTVTASAIDVIEASGPADTCLVLLRDGQVVARGDVGVPLAHGPPAPGTYRVEAWTHVPGIVRQGKDVPVMYSNRLRVAP